MAPGLWENDGLLQNRKGTDYSEIFDLRDYRSGDDVRAIHWKLSGKLDRLVVKEASDPTRYQVVLMPDLGREDPDGESGVKTAEYGGGAVRGGGNSAEYAGVQPFIWRFRSGPG